MNLLSQKEAINKMTGLRVGALFMDAGTGKTKTILDIYIAKNINIGIIWVTPAALIENLKKEILKWYPELMERISIFSSESISQSDNNFIKLNNMLDIGSYFLIVDESIKFKNLIAKRSKRLIQAAAKAKYRFILNGTPITRSILDLLAQIDILSPKILNMSEAQFASRFLIYRLDTGEKAPWRSWSKPCNEEALMKIVAPYVVETKLEINIQTIFNDTQCVLSDKELLRYKDFKERVLSSDPDERFDFLQIAQKFQHFYTLNTSKIEQIKKQYLPGTLYFVKFLFWFDIIPYIVKGLNVGIYNSIRKDNLEEFDVGVVTYGCGAFGLNLQKFNRIIFVDGTFDYGQKEQAIARVRRLGQNKDIYTYNLWTNTGLDAIIKESLNKKHQSFQHIKKILRNMNKDNLLCL